MSAKNAPSKDAIQAEQLADLSEAALKEFQGLLDADTVLIPDWREAAQKLVASGIPKDLDALRLLVLRVADAPPKEPVR